MPLAIFCNNPLSVSIVFERRAKYSGAIFKDSLHFQWWAGNFNFTFERVQHTFNENPAWSDIFLLNDITYKKILRYIFQVQSPISRSHHVIRARRSKRVVRNVVKKIFIVKREARRGKIKSQRPMPHLPFALNSSSELPTTWKRQFCSVVPNKVINQIIAMWFHSEILRET